MTCDFDVGHKGNRRRRNENEKGRKQLFRQWVVENNPVKNQRKKNHPKKEPYTKEEPADFPIDKFYARNWDDDVSDYWNKPRRIDLLNLIFLGDPPGYHDNAKDKMDYSSYCPKDEGQFFLIIDSPRTQ
jgi:hypothetical protein